MKTAAALVLASFFFGCAQHAPVGTLRPDSRSDLLFDTLLHQYPERYTLYHRVILTVRGKNYDFNGYLTREGDRITAVGFNDLGGRLFHIVSSPEKVEVLSKPGRMPATVLRDFVARELMAIFFISIEKSRLVQSAGDSAVLVQGRRSLEYLFSQNPQRCEAILIREDHERISLIQLRDYRIVPGWDREIPQTITVSNTKWDYEMTIRLLQIKQS